MPLKLTAFGNHSIRIYICEGKNPKFKLILKNIEKKIVRWLLSPRQTRPIKIDFLLAVRRTIASWNLMPICHTTNNQISVFEKKRQLEKCANAYYKRMIFHKNWPENFQLSERTNSCESHTNRKSTKIESNEKKLFAENAPFYRSYLLLCLVCVCVSLSHYTNGIFCVRPNSWFAINFGVSSWQNFYLLYLF